MSFDFKKEYKELHKPQIVTLPAMNYIAITGKGNPNDKDGDYQKAIGLLYGIAYTVKMNKKIDGYFDYVVPPLEGFWKQEGIDGFDYTQKDKFQWTSVIRLPDFVTKADFESAVEEATRKKKTDFSSVRYLTIEEGLCVQMMHIGRFDDEPQTVAVMDEYLVQNGYRNDFSDNRLHHEIYLSDARKIAPENCKTVIRHPIVRV